MNPSRWSSARRAPSPSPNPNPNPNPSVSWTPQHGGREDHAHGFLQDANEDDDADPHAMSDDDDDAFERGARQSGRNPPRRIARELERSAKQHKGGGFCGEAAHWRNGR